jgi:hypothetical protein
VIGEFYHLSDALSGLCRRLRFPSRNRASNLISPPRRPQWCPTLLATFRRKIEGLSSFGQVARGGWFCKSVQNPF